MLIRFIGDIHGNFQNYQRIIVDSEYSIQVGDFGIGFGIDPPKVAVNHRFIRGNHDNLSELVSNHDCKNWIPDGSLIQDKIFCVGGAYSVDKCLRTEGVDWWADEELSTSEWYDILDLYEEIRPQVVVSHDCPVKALLYPEYKVPTRTGQALSAMFDIHKPNLWVFGHYHTSIDHVVYGTRFVCVDQQRYIDIEV